MLVDACQSVPHLKVDVQSLNVDFLVASSHKVRFVTYVEILNLLDEYKKLRNKLVSDVWPYRHWILIC